MTKILKLMRCIRMLAVACLTNVALVSIAPTIALAASNPVIPNFWDPQERFIRPNVKSLPRLRFLTSTDFPPFSYVDRDKRLSGFHVDLARAICNELEVAKVCQIQALPFNELEKALNEGKGEAIIAGLAMTPQSLRRLDFSRPYFRLPARFVSLTNAAAKEPLVANLKGKSVGVVAGTAHAAFAKANFEAMLLRAFASQKQALDALQKKQVSAVFGDGLSLSFWLQGKDAKACCSFIGEPYLSERYFGSGLSVAVKKGSLELNDAMDYALRSVNDKGIFAELYLRYFPISLF